MDQASPAQPMFEHLGPIQRTDTFLGRFRRRALTVTLYAAALTLLVLGLPIILLGTITADLTMRTNGAFTRAVFFFILYFGAEIAGVCGSILIWLLSSIWARSDRTRVYRWHCRLRAAVVIFIVRNALRIFRVRLEIEGDTDYARKPFIFFMRHSSIADTLLPLYFAHLDAVFLRVILKREILNDPYVEISCNNLPNYFVRRAAHDNTKELEGVANMMNNLGPREGVFIYPEGTRFTEAKRDRILEKAMDSGDQTAIDRVKGFQRVLPPRLGGSMALLENNQGADAIFCAHAGLENSTTFTEFHNGGLVGATVRFKMWRVPFEDIPTTKDERIEWLTRQWRLVDDFVVSHLGERESDRQVA